MFWGLIMEPQRRYTQKVKKAFHISMAALDISASSDEPSQVMCGFEGRNYLLCTLRKPDLMQCSLDLNFDVGTEVSFAANGTCHIHLTGYLNEELEGLEEEQDDEEDEDHVEEGLEEEEDEEFANALTNSKKRTIKAENGQPKKKSKRSIVSSTQIASSDDDESDDNDAHETDEEKDDDSNLEEEGEDEQSDDDDEDSDSVEEEEDESDEEDEDVPAKATPKLNGVAKKAKSKPETAPSQKKDKKQQSEKTGKDQQNQQEKQGKEQQKQQSKKRTLQGGLVVEDLREGEGKPAKNGKFVNVYYEGRLKQNNKMFDSTTKGAGFSFRLGNGEVIKGWDLGVSGMKVGGKRRITCPPHMAYGPRGSPPAIPPNSTLVFEVELRKVN